MIASSGYELLDHPADLGFEVRAKDLSELFSLAACALSSVIVDADSVESSESVSVSIESADIELLMYDWLSEVLYRYDGEGLLFKKFQVSLIDQDGKRRLEAQLTGERFDSQRHQVKTYVKAITMHQLEVISDQSGCRATVFLDI